MKKSTMYQLNERLRERLLARLTLNDLWELYADVYDTTVESLLHMYSNLSPRKKTQLIDMIIIGEFTTNETSWMSLYSDPTWQCSESHNAAYECCTEYFNEIGYGDTPKRAYEQAIRDAKQIRHFRLGHNTARP